MDAKLREFRCAVLLECLYTTGVLLLLDCGRVERKTKPERERDINKSTLNLNLGSSVALLVLGSPDQK